MKVLALDNDKRLLALLLAGVLLMAVLTVCQDRLYAAFNGSLFFLSESVLFSSFWLLFVPLLFLQYKKLKTSVAIQWVIFWVLCPLLLHLLVFPFVIWFLSAAFYYHTFAMLQTVQYVLSEHSYTLLLVYSGWGLFLRLSTVKVREPLETAIPNTHLSALVVSSGGRYVQLSVADIVCIRAATPYVTIHLAGKQYLHTETLKSIADQLDSRQFVRIHKSCIVNVTKVVSYQSRFNGDYDIQLSDGSCVRLSRNYAASFKDKLPLRSE